MANVFISHSSTDSRWAEQIHQWLSEDSHNVFLDSDKNDGIGSGDDWQARLFERLRWADAVICVVTPSYLASPWCAAEIGAAQALGSEILPVRASSEPLDDRLLKAKQYVDVIRDASDARDRLRLRLSDIDGTGGRGWPDDASPYPGLRPFQLGDHRVFFGRTREIKEITERLRSPAERAQRAVLTVVGPSGCGKSSLIRAGVVPRIAGGDEWLALPPIVPGLDPIGNLVRSIASLVRERHLDFDVTSLRQDLQRDGLKAIATDLLVASKADSQGKLLIIIDQFEELLTQTEQHERAEFVAMLAQTLGGPVQALATMRPEFLEAAAKDADLQILPLRIAPLRPLAADALREVVDQPAVIAGLSFEDGLVTRLVTDTGSGDALPLLAFTLEQLADGVGRGGRLTHQRYDAVGGVQGALQRQADAALDEACAKTGATHGDVISALLGLVTIDETGRPAKRRVALDECSPGTAAQLDSFVARRLLSTEKAEGERTFVAVAHEAFLVNWPPLKDEIDADVTALRARRIVENAGNDWAAGGRDVGSLLQGRQLAKAMVDTGAELQRITEPSMPQRHWKTPGWWPGRRRLVTRVDLDETGREFLEASIRTDRARRLRRITQVAAVIAVLVVITAAAVVGFVQARDARDTARKQFRDATAQRLYAESQLMLSGMQQGGSDDVLAMQEAVAASRIASKHVDAKYPLLVALHQESDVLKIIDTAAVVVSVAVSPDGTRIASSGTDHTVRLWDAATGRRIGEPQGDHGDVLTHVAFSADGTRIASAAMDGTVRLWDAATGKPVGPPLHHEGAVNVAFSPDGTRIASCGADMAIRLWDTSTGQLVGQPLRGHENIVDSVAFNRDGTRLVSGGYDKTVRLWDTATGQSVGQPLRHNEWVTSVAFSPDGTRIASGGLDKTVRLWDAVTGQPVGEPLRHTSAVFSVAFSPDGARIASAGADKTIRLWDAATLRGIGELAGHRSAVESVAFSRDGRLVSGGDDKTVRVWDVSWQPMIGHDDTAGARFSDDGKRIASGGADKTVRWWDAATGRPIGAPLRVDDADVDWVAPVGEDRWVSFGTVNTVRLWDAHTGKPIGEPLRLPPDPLKMRPIDYEWKTHRIAARIDPRLDAVMLWNADTMQVIGETITHEPDVASIAFNEDGQIVATGSSDGSVRLWDSGSGKPIGQPMTGSGDVIAMAFSRDGHRLAVSHADQTLQLWDTGKFQSVGKLMHMDSMASAAAFSPDGRILASGGGDGTIRLWDVGDQSQLGPELTGHTSQVKSLDFSPDGTRFVSGSDDHTLRVWPVPTASPEALCAKLTHNMSRERWNNVVSPQIDYIEGCPGLPSADNAG